MEMTLLFDTTNNNANLLNNNIYMFIYKLKICLMAPFFDTTC